MARNLIPGDATIRAIRPTDPRKRLSDGEGLLLLLSPADGAHHWRFDYYFAGKRNMLSLGRYPDTGLALARRKADELRVSIAEGIDPSLKRKQAKQARVASQVEEARQAQGLPSLGSFEGVAREWFDVTKSGWAPSYADKIIARLEHDVFPYIGRAPVDSLTPPQLLEVMRRVESRGVIETAHRALENCGQVFRYAVATGRCPTNPARDLKDALRPPDSRHFLLHVDDPHRLDVMAAAGASQGDAEARNAKIAVGLQMLAYQIDGRHEQAAGHEVFAERLTRHPPIAAELVELAGLLQARNSLGANAVPGLEDTPLCLHAAYGAREVLTAVGWLTAARRAPFQAGVLPLASRKTELLFVTLDKSEGFHDRISYYDYAISAERFHWQTQNCAGTDRASGRRYLESLSNGWQFQLFVRPRKGDAYRACGPVALESAEGDRPMSIVWVLRTPLPARLFREFSVLRAADAFRINSKFKQTSTRPRTRSNCYGQRQL